MNYKKQKGFSLIELLTVIAIVGILAGIVFVATGSARARARDVKRKQELTQIGRFLAASNCYMPNAGAGEYDLAELFNEVKAKYSQVAQVANLPIDPKSGSETQTNYRYQVIADNHCILYANLENENEAITLSTLTAPTAGGGTGVLKAQNKGPNGTNIFYQIGR
jgi:prepilin-type N-terminal cleavage/methylation domain-containing protein